MLSTTNVDQTVACLGGILRALKALREEVLPVNPELYNLLAEGPLEQVRRLIQDLAVSAD